MYRQGARPARLKWHDFDGQSVASLRFQIASLMLTLVSVIAWPASAQDPDETCILDWVDTEPDQLCITIDWSGLTEQYSSTGTTGSEILFWGLVEVDICVIYPTCVNNLPLLGAGLDSPCETYSWAYSCTGSGTPLYRPSLSGGPDLVCLETGFASFYLSEGQSGPGVSGIPIRREVGC